MKIEADKDGIKAVQQLCDVALKSGGVANLQGVAAVLNSLKETKEKDGGKNNSKD